MLNCSDFEFCCNVNVITIIKNIKMGKKNHK
jgi:hypothetical protein